MTDEIDVIKEQVAKARAEAVNNPDHYDLDALSVQKFTDESGEYYRWEVAFNVDYQMTIFSYPNDSRIEGMNDDEIAAYILECWQEECNTIE